MNQKKNGLFKNLFFVFAITFLAKIMGFAREMVYGSQLGISNLSDNFVMAQTIPVTLYAILTQAFRTTYIPNLFKIKKKEGDKAQEAFTGNYIVAVSIASFIMFFLLVIFAKPLTLLFAGGFAEEDISQTVYLTRFISITVLFGGLIDILNGYLQSSGHYNIGASLTIFSNAVFCIFLMLFPLLGYKALIWGSVVSKGTELIIVICASKINKLNIRFSSWKYFSYTTSALKNSIPVLLGSVITDLGNLIDKRFATMLIGGTVSALNYSNKIQLMIVQLFSVSIGSVLFPELSKISDDKQQFSKMIEKGLIYIYIVMIPIFIGVITISNNLVAVFFQRGAFDSQAVIITSQCLTFYAPAILFTVCYEFLSKACFALHDTKSPIIMSAIGMGVNIAFNALLIHQFQHKGLAFSTSLSMFISFIGVYLILRKKLSVNSMNQLKIICKVGVSSLIMAVVIYMEHKLYFNNKYIAFIIYSISGVIVYYISLLLVRCEGIKELTEMFFKKIRRPKN